VEKAYEKMDTTSVFTLTIERAADLPIIFNIVQTIQNEDFV
jgi:hypothetical protein